MTGSLLLVGTPIGNLGDMSARAVEALGNADVIACEDTRRTGPFLDKLGVDERSLMIVNDHTEAQAAARIGALLTEGRTVALVSDAGMPGISDPGHLVVQAAIDAGAEVSVVPGPSAAVAALVLSGLPSARFCFEGFLPRKGSGRAGRLAALAGEERTMVFFEGPHRVERTLGDLAEAFGADRPVAIAREITKLHEEVWRGTLADARVWAATPPKGELVLVVGGAQPPGAPADDAVREALRDRLRDGSTKKDAVAEVARVLGVNKNAVYELALDL